jgi:hypothetical protein
MLRNEPKKDVRSSAKAASAAWYAAVRTMQTDDFAEREEIVMEVLAGAGEGDARAYMAVSIMGAYIALVAHLVSVDPILYPVLMSIDPFGRPEDLGVSVRG